MWVHVFGNHICRYFKTSEALGFALGFNDGDLECRSWAGVMEAAAHDEVMASLVAVGPNSTPDTRLAMDVAPLPRETLSETGTPAVFLRKVAWPGLCGLSGGLRNSPIPPRTPLSPFFFCVPALTATQSPNKHNRFYMMGYPLAGLLDESQHSAWSRVP